MLSLTKPDGTVFGAVKTVETRMLSHARKAKRKASQEAYAAFKAANPLEVK